MTVDELFNDCWRDLPLVRRNIAGKEATRQVFIDTLREWDSPTLAACVTDEQVEVYEDALQARVERRGGERYGFVILTIVLIAIASAVISWLVQRWLDHTFPREQFEAMRVGL